MPNNCTTIRITATDDGKGYKMEILENDAKNGSRIDQKIANNILQFDKRMQDPQTMNMIQQMRQNPAGMMQQMLGGMLGGMMPWGNNGGGFNPFMGR